MYYELAQTTSIELRAAEQTIHQRMEWDEIKTIERLEKALRVARGRANLSPVAV